MAEVKYELESSVQTLHWATILWIWGVSSVETNGTAVWANMPRLRGQHLLCYTNELPVGLGQHSTNWRQVHTKKALPSSELAILLRSVFSLCPIAPKHVAGQQHLSGNPAKPAGATQHGSSWPAICLGSFGCNEEALPYRTVSSIGAGVCVGGVRAGPSPQAIVWSIRFRQWWLQSYTHFPGSKSCVETILDMSAQK